MRSGTELSQFLRVFLPTRNKTESAIFSGGTHNLTDEDSIDSILNDYTQLAETVKCINGISPQLFRLFGL